LFFHGHQLHGNGFCNRTLDSSSLYQSSTGSRLCSLCLLSRILAAIVLGQIRSESALSSCYVASGCGKHRTTLLTSFFNKHNPILSNLQSSVFHAVAEHIWRDHDIRSPFRTVLDRPSSCVESFVHGPSSLFRACRDGNRKLRERENADGAVLHRIV